jgi:hypothetical protein
MGAWVAAAAMSAVVAVTAVGGLPPAGRPSGTASSRPSSLILGWSRSPSSEWPGGMRAGSAGCATHCADTEATTASEPPFASGS